MHKNAWYLKGFLHCGHYLPDSKVSGNLGAKILGILGKEMAEFPNTFESCEYSEYRY